MQAPLSIVQSQEMSYLEPVIYTTTKGFSSAAGFKRTNIGNSVRMLVNRGVIPTWLFQNIKDPHAKQVRKACVDHKTLLMHQSRIIDFWEDLGRTKSWIWNALWTMELSAMYYKYCTLKNIEHPEVAGFLTNVHHSKGLRNKARKSLQSVPTSQLTLFAA